MKERFNKVAVFFIVLISCIILSSGSVSAQVANEPFLDYVGSFDYNDFQGGQGSTRGLLSFTSWNITGGNYIGGSQFNEGDDPITNAVFSIGNLFNDNSAPGDNLIFGATRGTNDPVTFTIADGGTTYFSATLNNFVIEDGMFGTRLLLNSFTDGIFTNPTFNANGSQYITELESRYNAGWDISLGMDFAFNSGSSGGGTAFTDDAFGTVTGKIGVVPEPISSILFLTGGATLAARHYRKRKRSNRF